MANEKRLIDANALIDEWNEIIKRMVKYSDGKTPVDFGLVIREVSKAPTVDAVEVVRCKDCKYYSNHPNGLCYANAEEKPNGTEGLRCVDPDDFCSFGERKDNDSI